MTFAKRVLFFVVRVILFFPLVFLSAALLYAFLPSPGPTDLEADALFYLGQDQDRSSESFRLTRVFQ